MQLEMNELRTKMTSEVGAEVAAQKKAEEAKLNEELAQIKKAHADQVPR